MDPWYTTKPVGDGVTLVLEDQFAPWLRCNIWHVRGRDFDLVIDTGMGFRPLKAEIASVSEKPVKVISTHAHFDHMGGAYEFDTRLGHESEAEIHAAPTSDNTAGYREWVRAECFKSLPYENYDISTYTVRPAPLTGYLDDGDVVDLGDRHFQVLHLPGHSPGSIGLFEEKTGILFSGDALYDGDLLDNLYHSDKEQFHATMDRLRSLPATTVHGGHYDSFGREKMFGLIDRYLAGKMSLVDIDAFIEAQVAKGAANDDT